MLLGNGDGTFRPAVGYSSGAEYATSVAVADVNLDGTLDLIVTNPCPNTGCIGPVSTGVVAILLGNGDGTFQGAITYNSGGAGPTSAVAVDVNGDGKPDLLIANQSLYYDNPTGGVLAVLLGNGDGTFQTSATFGTGGYAANALAVSDLNRDGKLDIVIANECVDKVCSIANGFVGVLLGNGDGTFKTVTTFASGGPFPLAVAVVDVDGDGNLDVVVANECADSACASSTGSAGVLRGNGDGTLQAPVTYSSGGGTAISVAAGDVNGDGKTDLLSANTCVSTHNCNNGQVGVLINLSTRATTSALQSSLNPSSYGQSVAFTVTVTPSVGTGVPTGTITFLDASTSLGTATLNGSGMATYSTSTLSVGNHSITASYSGDSNFGSSVSPVLSQVVQGAIGSASPAALNFGSVTVGISSGTQIATLTNTGNLALSLTSIAASFSNGTYTQSNNCGSSLAAAASCTVTLTWDPKSAGGMTGSLMFSDSATNTPQVVTISGTGVTPAVKLSPSSLTFATQVVNTSSAGQSVTLTNTGLGTLTLTKVSVSAQFTETNTCGFSVVAGASCTITVKFKPTAINTITGTISVTDNAIGSPQKVTLTGTGTYVQLSPTSENFGNQPVGTTSLSKKITLSNKGSVAVSSVVISLTGTNPGDFAQTNTCGTSVAAGASCFITVTFTPTVKGRRTANVSVSDNGGGSPQMVSLTGTGT